MTLSGDAKSPVMVYRIIIRNTFRKNCLLISDIWLSSGVRISEDGGKWGLASTEKQCAFLPP